MELINEDFLDLTLSQSGGTPTPSTQLFDFKWAKQAPNAQWVEANGDWVTNKDNAYNKLVQDAQGINSKFYVVPIKSKNDIIETVTTSWTQPVLSSNGTIGGNDYACISSSTEYGYVAHKAFDNNLTTQWGASSGSTPQSLTFYAPEPLKLLSVYLDFKAKTEVWTSGEIQGSNDNDTWTTLTTFNNNTDVVITLPIETENYYQYIRFYGTAHGSTGYGKVQEMKLTALRANDYIINKSITLKKTTLNFYAILDENNHRFVLPQADYYIPDTDMKLYFYLG